jgi:hypothetical protein
MTECLAAHNKLVSHEGAVRCKCAYLVVGAVCIDVKGFESTCTGWLVLDDDLLLEACIMQEREKQCSLSAYSSSL